MSYSVWEWFDDYFLPTLKKNRDDKDRGEADSFDIFLKSIKQSLMKSENDFFVGTLINALINPSDDDMDIPEKMYQCFSKLNHYNEETLLSLKYRKNGSTTVNINYQDFESES